MDSIPQIKEIKAHQDLYLHVPEALLLNQAPQVILIPGRALTQRVSQSLQNHHLPLKAHHQEDKKSGSNNVAVL